jgi:hypothetical protein
MGLTTKFVSSYRNDKGTDVYVHAVSGSASELEAYKIAQGEHYREDEATGKVLFFDGSPDPLVSDTGKLGISQKTGNVYVDDSEIRRATKEVAKAGGNLGAEMAKAYAQRFISGGARVNTAPVAEAIVSESSEEEIDI